MAVFTGTANATAELVLPSTPQIENIVIAAIDTEQSFAIPNGTKHFRLRTRGRAVLKYSYTSGESGTKYITIPPLYTEVVDNIDSSGLVIYFQANRIDTVELILWRE